MRESQASLSRPSFARRNSRTAEGFGTKYWIKLENGATEEEVQKFMRDCAEAKALPELSDRRMYDLVKAAERAGLVSVRTSQWKAASQF